VNIIFTSTSKKYVVYVKFYLTYTND